MKVISDHAEVERIIYETIDAVLDKGGYIHPDLEFHCDRSHEYGALRLEGVANDTLSLRVPKWMPSWLDPHIALGRTIDRQFNLRHAMEKGLVIPLLDMANHKFKGGKLVHQTDDYELYGTTYCYTMRPERLKELGINGL